MDMPCQIAADPLHETPKTGAGATQEPRNLGIIRRADPKVGVRCTTTRISPERSQPIRLALRPEICLVDRNQTDNVQHHVVCSPAFGDGSPDLRQANLGCLRQRLAGDILKKHCNQPVDVVGRVGAYEVDIHLACSVQGFEAGSIRLLKRYANSRRGNVNGVSLFPDGVHKMRILQP